MQTMQIFLLVVLCIILNAADCKVSVKEARTIAELISLHNCDCNKDTKQIFFVDYTSYNRTYSAANANWTALEPFDDSYSFHAEGWEWNDENSEWKEWKKLDKSDACSTLYKIFDPLWTTVMKIANANSGCPLQPGVYHLNNYAGSDEVDHSKPSPSLKMLHPGKFKIVVHVVKDSKVEACAEFQLNVREIYE